MGNNNRHRCFFENVAALSCLVIVCFLSSAASAGTEECTCNNINDDIEQVLDTSSSSNKRRSAVSLKYRVIGIATVVVAGGVGVSLPLVGRKLEYLRPEKDIFTMIKAFAAGVILSTGFVHILPDAFHTLTSTRLNNPCWAKFPFSGFIALMASIATLILDTFAMTFFTNKKMHNHKLPIPNNNIKQQQQQVEGDYLDDEDQHMHVAAHIHIRPSNNNNEIPLSSSSSYHIRQRVVSQVLELGIVVHSVIIGLSLGTSETPETTRPLLVALSFHQFFEGVGLGGCISQAKFKSVSTAVMALFFSVTTPVGIAIGIGISSTGFYNEHSSVALITQGILNSASAGILIYMALVNL